MHTPAEPIAIVGIGCRFPGGASHPDEFWELLKTGRDAIVDIPPDRWNIRRFYDADASKPGKMYVKQGGFLQQRVDTFDALFFGIAPREAECLDPQQRVLLETSWEALEDAGIPADTLAGSNTGVFIGAFTLDHQLTQMGKMNRQVIGTHTAIGSTMTILSNRISYVLDLCGPSLSVDTACSSSLVAVHLACHAIWRGECDLAMAGGVNVMMRPEYPIAMCKGGFLAPDARSKSFDARANGYGRGEGAGVVVLKRVADAVRDGDAIYAVVRGTGANQDGRTNGITVPNPDSQRALIQQVCAQAAVDPRDIHYIEAHGTGTAVGDPLEAQALGAALGPPEDRRPCWVGSVKATIGHLEAAAGVASVIKTALCLSHRQVPPQANLETPNPNIPFVELGLALPRQLEVLAPDAETVCAGVNAFGYGGTNAHAILQTAPPVEARQQTPDHSGRIYCVPLSARSDEALTALAKAWLDRFGNEVPVDVSDLSYSAACRRGHHPYRLAVTGASWADLRGQLQAFAEEGRGKWLASGKVVGASDRRPVLVYTGMGPQWWAMGRELYHQDSVYRTAVDACDASFQRVAGWSIVAEMLKEEQESRIRDTAIAQPANFVLQVGLTALWRSFGIEPAAVVGHSVGEVSAAYVAGVLSLDEAVLVSYHRSRIQNQAAGLGKMLAVGGLSQDHCAELVDMTQGAVSIAAINSPSSLTLAGDADALDAIAAYVTDLGEFNRFLQVEVAYHSPLMDPLKPELRSVLAGLRPQLPTIPLYSTITGEVVTRVLYDAEYWCDNIREPVRFAHAIGSLIRDGHRMFLEVGPHPVLSTSLKECGRHHNIQPQMVASLRREKPERRTVTLGLAELYVAGCTIDWRRLYADDARYIKLPTYPWQRDTYWSEHAESQADRVGEPLHPLLDHRVSDPTPTWESTVNRHILPYLHDHQVDGLVVMPGAVYVEAGLAAVRHVTGRAACVMEQLTFHQALVLSEQGHEPVLHVVWDQGRGAYSFFSREGDDPSTWQCHASGTARAAEDTPRQGLDRNAIASRCHESVSIEQLYADLATRGLRYGQYFRTVTQLHRGHHEVWARIELHPDLLADDAGYCLHPSLLDGCFQSLIVARDDREKFYMPVAITRITYYGKPGRACWCAGTLTHITEHGIVGELRVCDEAGTLLVHVEGLRCRALSSPKEDIIEQVKHWTYAWQWTPHALSRQTARTGHWLVFSDSVGVGAALCRELETHPGNRVTRITMAEVYHHDPSMVQSLSEPERQQLRRLLQQANANPPVGVVYCWGLDRRHHPADPVGMAHTGAALHVIQLLASVCEAHPPRLYLVTDGAQVVVQTDVIDHLAQTPLIGLARVAFNEYPALRCTVVDVSAIGTTSTIRALAQEVLADDREDDVALRGPERYVHRLERLPVDPAVVARPAVHADDVPAFCLQGQGQPAFHAMPLPVPTAGDVTVAVEYMNVTEMTRQASDHDDMPQGYFAVGVITAVAEGVSQWSVGERVLVAAEGTPASHVVCPIDRVFSANLCPTLADAELAAVTTTLIPAYYALHTLARLAPGERVLIDAALGVRAVAIHTVARWLAATPQVYRTTTGLPFLEHEPVIDVSHPGALRELYETVTVQPIRAWVHGSQADHQTAIERVLTPDTHELVFAEGGGTPSATCRFGSRAALDAFTLACTAPQIFGQLLNDVAQRIGSQPQARPLVQMLSLHEGLAWFSGDRSRVRTHATILACTDLTTVEVVDDRPPTRVDPDATYLITGGFGGFGLEATQWLAKHGAKHLVLVGRRGAVEAHATRAVHALEQHGVQVLAVAADIADEAQVAALLTQVASHCPPLKGVFHAAAVLDDASISELDPARMARVMRAKALGAWHLHRLTQAHPLDFFLLFSSVSALIGNARQANYVAANTFLDALASYRHGLGLPATSISWGAIAAGMAVASADVTTHLALMGMETITVAQALEAWSMLRDLETPHYGVMKCDWPRWQAFEPTGGQSPRFAHLMTAGEALGPTLTERCQAIRALPEAEQAAAMCQAVAEQVAHILRLPVAKIDVHHGLSQMGVDSLMSMELQSAIDDVFGVRISTLELIRSKSLIHLADLLMDRTMAAADRLETGPEIREASVVDRLSAEEVDILLNQLLLEVKT